MGEGNRIPENIQTTFKCHEKELCKHPAQIHESGKKYPGNIQTIFKNKGKGPRKHPDQTPLLGKQDPGDSLTRFKGHENSTLETPRPDSQVKK